MNAKQKKKKSKKIERETIRASVVVANAQTQTGAEERLKCVRVPLQLPLQPTDEMSGSLLLYMYYAALWWGRYEK